MKPISNNQIKMLHALKAALAWPEYEYRGMLYVMCAVRSSKDLDFEQADMMIENMQRVAVKSGVWKADGKQLLGDRPGFATERQVLYIKGLWRKVSKYQDDKQRESALRQFLMRVVKVSDVRFVRDYQASKVIEDLKAMQERGESKKLSEFDKRMNVLSIVREVGNG